MQLRRSDYISEMLAYVFPTSQKHVWWISIRTLFRWHRDILERANCRQRIFSKRLPTSHLAFETYERPTKRAGMPSTVMALRV